MIDSLRPEGTEDEPPTGDPAPSDERRPARLRLEDCFLGRVRGWGVFQDRFGRVRLEFTVDMHGERTRDGFLLHEDFRYADGRRDLREWRITPLGDGRFEARSADVVGVARGEIKGTHMRWRYRLRVPVGKRHVTMRFDDRMFLQADGVLINVSEARKWGLLVGRLSAAFRRLD